MCLTVCLDCLDLLGGERLCFAYVLRERIRSGSAHVRRPPDRPCALVGRVRDSLGVLGEDVGAELVANNHVDQPISRDIANRELRSDARSVVDLDEAIDRATAYRDAGADMIFPEGLESEAEFEAFASACPGLLLANMTEFGHTPDITAPRFAELGYDLVIYPLSMMRLAMGTVARGLAALRRDGTVAGVLDEMQTRSELYDLLDYTPGEPWLFPANR